LPNWLEEGDFSRSEDALPKKWGTAPLPNLVLASAAKAREPRTRAVSVPAGSRRYGGEADEAAPVPVGVARHQTQGPRCPPRSTPIPSQLPPGPSGRTVANIQYFVQLAWLITQPLRDHAPSTQSSALGTKNRSQRIRSACSSRPWSAQSTRSTDVQRATAKPQTKFDLRPSILLYPAGWPVLPDSWWLCSVGRPTQNRP
jgi:hypothetical protein